MSFPTDKELDELEIKVMSMSRKELRVTSRITYPAIVAKADMQIARARQAERKACRDALAENRKLLKEARSPRRISIWPVLMGIPFATALLFSIFISNIFLQTASLKREATDTMAAYTPSTVLQAAAPNTDLTDSLKDDVTDAMAAYTLSTDIQAAAPNTDLTDSLKDGVTDAMAAYALSSDIQAAAPNTDLTDSLKDGVTDAMAAYTLSTDILPAAYIAMPESLATPLSMSIESVEKGLTNIVDTRYSGYVVWSHDCISSYEDGTCSWIAKHYVHDKIVAGSIDNFSNYETSTFYNLDYASVFRDANPYPVMLDPLVIYEVRENDNLWGVAYELTGDGVNYNIIASLNGISSENSSFIQQGQVIGIPVSMVEGGLAVQQDFGGSLAIDEFQANGAFNQVIGSFGDNLSIDEFQANEVVNALIFR